ncbi:hypothetical protein [Effusibacillus lacus]|uniref:Single-stranded DNA-binding protein n=1 Tax=Effusibacillus lacus TaxID=1348429 RepID=A0A292YN92_9BACL|nr:hypothetical protein [Effusibacillus lacus]TCS71435.1 hypothetical protein EDD64_12653 [Effusibacillus lacus]GAX89965.1 hypothetical protein EFBL_1591 [Effusibacillus lacus]
MKITGKIVRKRAYFDSEDTNVNCIAFIEIDDGVLVNGDKIKIIPMLSDGSQIPQDIGESVEIEGEIVFKQIFTSSGKRNSSPVPILQPSRIDKVS